MTHYHHRVTAADVRDMKVGDTFAAQRRIDGMVYAGTATVIARNADGSVEIDFTPGFTPGFAPTQDRSAPWPPPSTSTP